MKRDIQQVIKDVDRLQSAAAEDHDRLEDLMEEYFQSGNADADLDVWFRLYERLPDDNGTGHFTRILHNLEEQKGYARSVVRSVQRRPTRCPILMLARVLDRMQYESYPSGFNEEFGLGLLYKVAENESVEASLRDIAAARIDDYLRRRDEPDDHQSSR